MSAKKDPEEYEYDEDEDEDEADFVPGAEDEDEEEEETIPLLDGRLFLDEERKVHYQGEGFHLTSTSAASWNPLLNEQNQEDEKAKASNNNKESTTYSLEMEGTCAIVPGAEGKPPHRKMQVSWTVVLQQQDSSLTPPDGKMSARLKKGDDNEEEEDSKLPAFSYKVYGRQVDTGEIEEILEFQGSYHPSSSSAAATADDGKPQEVSLLCQARIVSPKPVAASAAGKPAAAVARASEYDNDEDEDEDYDDADVGVDYDELIALREEAGLPVDALRKRYRDEEGEMMGNSSAAASATAKKGKAAAQEEEDDDDDEDYGF